MDLVVKAWKDVEWDDLQSRFEEEVRAIGERQDDGETGRKHLVEESNKYRETTDKETRKVAVPLIKAFQKEVDRLTAANKTAESTLIEICSRLTGIPDPEPILEQAPQWKSQAEKTNQAIEEANQLRVTVADLHTEFADLKNQDVTIRQLRDRIKQLESEKTVEVDQAVSETERRLVEEQAATQFETNMRSDKLKAENQNLEKKLADLEQKMKEAQRRQDMARQSADQRETFQLEQIEILTRDVESANRRVFSLESDCSRLSSELAEALEKSKRGGLEDIAAFGGLMKEKDEQMTRLREENKQLLQKMETESKRSHSIQTELAKELEKQRVSIRDFESKLADMNDYEAIKKELSLLREIEFGEAADANEEAITKLGETVQSLDRLLAEKNRRLQNDNAQLRQRTHQQQGSDGDIMKAILAGSHQSVVDAVTKNVGLEIAEQYMVPEIDFSLDRKINRSIKTSQRAERPVTRSPGTTATATANIGVKTEDDSQNLFKILMNMGSPSSSGSLTNGSAGQLRTREKSPQEIPFEQFRYSPKLTNYTGEPSKSPQEMKTIQELQSCVASNIRNLGTKALNTAEIAKQCKRLMVAYNIGQRLFAKYVMNQVVKSQGSLSELLSKPRHWSKLTDKGREAFRRIYGWLSDDKAIGLLVALSPRRVWPTDQKVEHPTPESMWEVNSANLPQEEQEEERRLGAASAREDQYRLAGTSQAANSGTTQRNSRWRHDDIPKEKIISIFNSEMAKLREQESNLERAIASRSFGTGHVRRMDDLNSPYHEMSHSERMASINQAHLVMQKRMSAGLHPITQDQFELFGHVDTEDVVRQIKEFLSMNSISQRQFGEHVLGLSQGSVSDLLARPKQWNMLTQKGREPFIRMKLFMREITIATEKARKEKENSDKKGGGDLPSFSHTIVTTPIFHAIKEEEEDEEDYPLEVADDDSDGYLEPDTAILVRKVKDRLHLHGISQRLFGEHILGISAGGCSELFLRPRPWSTLNARSKEPYEKIILWLQDKEGIAKLLAKERDGGYMADFNENGKRLSDPPYDPPPRKVQRTVITDQQKEALRFVFQHEQHPSQKTVELLAIKLNLNIRTVNNWFHNHRTRQKASMKEGKIYTPAEPLMPKSSNWQEDLAAMLDNVSQSCVFDDGLPTMVTIPNLSFDEGTDEEEELEGQGDDKPSQLDKAVERMRLLAAAKCP